MKINPPTFNGTKADKDLKCFIDEVFKVVDVIWVTSKEKEELPNYQLKYVAQVCLSDGGMRDT